MFCWFFYFLGFLDIVLLLFMCMHIKSSSTICWFFIFWVSGVCSADQGLSSKQGENEGDSKFG